MKALKLWWKQLWCNHDWELIHYSEGHYDEECWYECTKCKKQFDYKEN